MEDNILREARPSHSQTTIGYMSRANEIHVVVHNS